MLPLSSSRVLHPSESFSILNISWSPTRVLTQDKMASSRGANHAISPGWFGTRQVGHQGLARGLIRLPLPHIRKRRERHELPLIEASESRIHHILGSHHDFLG